MDNKRRRERNRIYNEIKLLEGYISTNEATIERTRKSSFDTEFAVTKVKKLKLKNEEHRQTILDFKERLGKLRLGELDEEIKAEFDRNSSILNSKEKARKERIHNEKTENEEKKKQSRAFYQASKDSDRSFYRKKCDMDRTFKYYQRCLDSIPDYMIQKLQNMPQNKGYIWRGVYCYGDLPVEEGKPIVMFERHKNVLLIHEWTKTEYKKFEKIGKDRKKLVECKPIR